MIQGKLVTAKSKTTGKEVQAVLYFGLLYPFDNPVLAGVAASYFPYNLDIFTHDPDLEQVNDNQT